MMRLFLAIEIADVVHVNLRAMQERLRAADADVRWLDENHLHHLTVVMLGDQPDGQISEIEACVAPVAEETAPFRFNLRGGSAFPRRGPIKTLWIGVDEGADAWQSLMRRTRESLAPVGVAPLTDLAAHTTLGRVKGERNMDALQAALVQESDTDCGMQTADCLVLVQTFLNPEGAAHQEIRRFPFAG